MLKRSNGSVCLFCRLSIFSQPRAPLLKSKQSSRKFTWQGAPRTRYSSRAALSRHSSQIRSEHTEGGTQPNQPNQPHDPKTTFILSNEKQQQRHLDGEVPADDTGEGGDQLDIRSQLGPEAVARYARKRFGERLPEGALRDEEYRVYERMYGTPLPWEPHHEEEQVVEDEEADLKKDDRDVLLKEGPDGKLEEVEIISDEETPDLNDEELESDDANVLVQKDITNALTTDLRDEPDETALAREEDVPVEDPTTLGETSRAHPYTIASRAGTDPSTIEIPKHSVVLPVSSLLAETKNRHLDEAAEKALGGPGLPYGVGTPRVSRKMPQKPIPLSAHQHRMSSIEADVYLASLVPGMYASTMSVLVELRRRLGTGWIQSLLEKASEQSGPSMLDAGAGGASALAWRDMLGAEVERMREDQTLPTELQSIPDAAHSKTTVLTGSDELRHRASVLLNNTTFLPRLPDYFHLTPKPNAQSSADTNPDGPQPHARKQYDLIVAPHSLWSLTEEWQRRQHIQNLWAMLNPDGGVLVLMEKGIPRGFEVIAGARQYIIDALFTNTANNRDVAGADEGSYTDGKSRHAAPGAIIAPCTTQAKCPMYRFSGLSQQRKDYCHFSQRYLRPYYFQRLLGAKNRNHEDVKFSYVAVQKGRTPETLGQVMQVDTDGSLAVRDGLTGQQATDRAFEGYDVHDEDLAMPRHSNVGTDLQAQPIAQRALTTEERASALAATGDVGAAAQDPPHPAPHPLTLPHLVMPPLKRPGHIMLDVCTPSGTLERWAVPRSYSKAAYRDARKSAWGDGWALGAKTREYRKIRIGKGLGTVDGKADVAVSIEPSQPAKAKKEEKFRGRLKARARKRAEKKAMREADEDGDGDGE